MKAAAGDRRAMEALIRAHQDALYAFILRMSGRPEVAEDIVQEAFVRVLKNLGRFDNRFRFSTWLFTIAKRLYMNSMQKLTPTFDTTTVAARQSAAADPWHASSAAETKSACAVGNAMQSRCAARTPSAPSTPRPAARPPASGASRTSRVVGMPNPESLKPSKGAGEAAPYPPCPSSALRGRMGADVCARAFMVSRHARGPAEGTSRPLCPNRSPRTITRALRTSPKPVPAVCTPDGRRSAWQNGRRARGRQHAIRSTE